MRVWRIGSKWGDINILPIIKEYNIVFAGEEVEDRIQEVKPNDLIAITYGQPIIAIGKVKQLIDLKSIKEKFSEEYADVTAVKIDPLFLAGEYDFDFGHYPGQGKQFHEAQADSKINIINIFNQLNKIKMQKDIESLLEYKKQIILQGPPGTGKTRLAKLIAEEMTKPFSIDSVEIRKNIKIGQEIATISDTAKFTIKSISNDSLTYERHSTNKIATLSFADIIKAYSEKRWLNVINGSDPYSAPIAKCIYDNYEDNSSKIIQFHPAYSYEDFVRGITAKANGVSVEYKAENKILADFAKMAQENCLESKKDAGVISVEKWIEKKLNEFIVDIKEKLDKKTAINLTDATSITNVEDDAIIYKGQDWGGRLKFDQIKLLYSLDIKSNDDLQKVSGLNKTVYRRPTYYLSILKMFREKFPFRKEDITENKKVDLKKFVLIIDEINRANLPAVLGELIYALEYRGKEVESIYEIDEERKIIMPPNLYLIGTMNTADRSVGHIDYAIRRRFAFVDVLPTPEPIREVGKELFKKVSSLFIKNFDTIDWLHPKLERSEFLASDFRPDDVWLGHSYFITNEKDETGKLLDEKEQLKIKLEYEIKPILKEYLKDGILNESAREIIEKLPD